MDESVDERNEACTMISRELESNPTCKRHNRVMENMQSWDVSELLSQNEEYCVCQIQELGDVIRVSKGHEKMFLKFCLRVIIRSTFPGRQTKPRIRQGNHEADSVQENEEDIVSQHHPLQVISLTVLHERRTPMFDEHVVEKEDRKEFPRTSIHKRKSSCDGMWSVLPKVMIIVWQSSCWRWW